MKKVTRNLSIISVGKNDGSIENEKDNFEWPEPTCTFVLVQFLKSYAI